MKRGIPAWLIRLAAAMILLAQGLAARAADPLEGRWQINGEGALLEFRLSVATAGALDIVWIDGPALDIEPETLIGTAIPTAEPGVYDCNIALDPRQKNSARRRADDFRLTLRTAHTFSLEPYRRTRRISLWRWLPYLFRVTVINEDTRPSNLDGATRVGAPPTFIVI